MAESEHLFKNDVIPCFTSRNTRANMAKQSRYCSIITLFQDVTFTFKHNFNMTSTKFNVLWVRNINVCFQGVHEGSFLPNHWGSGGVFRVSIVCYIISLCNVYRQVEVAAQQRVEREEDSDSDDEYFPSSSMPPVQPLLGECLSERLWSSGLSKPEAQPIKINYRYVIITGRGSLREALPTGLPLKSHT